MEEKEIIYQILFREIDNILANFGTLAQMFSPTLKSYAKSLLDPYLEAFTNKTTGSINTKAAEAFLKEQANDKVAEFMKRFESEKES